MVRIFFLTVELFWLFCICISCDNSKKLEGNTNKLWHGQKSGMKRHFSEVVDVPNKK